MSESSILHFYDKPHFSETACGHRGAWTEVPGEVSCLNCLHSRVYRKLTGAPTPRRPRVIHYIQPSGRKACGVGTLNGSFDPEEVTCRNCLSSPAMKPGPEIIQRASERFALPERMLIRR